MTMNFRSRPEIVQFYNDYITNDPNFSSARIDPPKPLVDGGQRQAKTFLCWVCLGPIKKVSQQTLQDFWIRLINQRSVAIGATGQEIRMSQEGTSG